MVRLLVVLVVLALPASAAAKELTALDVCGASGCGRVTDRDVLHALLRSDDHAVASPTGAQRSYLLRVRVRDEEGVERLGWTSRWLPTAGVLAYEESAGRFRFTTPDPALLEALRTATRAQAARTAREYGPPAAPARHLAAPEPAGNLGLPAVAWAGAGAAIVLLAAGWALRASRAR